jgi:hypothetical protein
VAASSRAVLRLEAEVREGTVSVTPEREEKHGAGKNSGWRQHPFKGGERSRGGVRESGDAWGRAWFALAEAGGLTSSLSSSHTQTDGPHLGVQDQEVPPLTLASAGRGNIERGCRQYHQITPCLLQMESLPWEQ